MRKAVDEYQSTMNGKSVLAVAVGTFILGIGMTLAGAVRLFLNFLINKIIFVISLFQCPGMVLPQTGAWAYMASELITYFQ